MLHRQRSSLLLSTVSIIFIIAFPLVAGAQANLDISNAIGTVGDTIAVEIRLSGASNVAGIEFHLAYSADRLQFVQINSNVLTDMTVGNANSAVNVIWEDMYNTIDAVGPVIIATIKFEILPSLPDSTELLLTAAEIVNDIGDPYPLITNNGWIVFSPTTDVLDNDGNSLPDEYFLEANHPNPFNSSTVISFGLPRLSDVSLSVYNIIGQKVSTLVEGQLKAGYYTYLWDGEKSASGVYFYRLKAGEFLSTHKMILLK